MPDIEKVQDILEYMNKECSFVHSPKFLTQEEFDKLDLLPQDSEIKNVFSEYINQSGPMSPAGDDFSGTMAWKIGDQYFSVQYSS